MVMQTETISRGDTTPEEKRASVVFCGKKKNRKLSEGKRGKWVTKERLGGLAWIIKKQEKKSACWTQGGENTF